MRVRRTLATVNAIAIALTACSGSGGSAVARGDRLYHGDATCAVCHGQSLEGTSMAPSFLSDLFSPEQHPDGTFRDAIRNGVQPHGHFDAFGPMLPLPHLGGDDIDAVIAYVRSVQQEHGIGEPATDPEDRNDRGS